MDADIIIVGGGPAGATAARLLSSQGISTLVLDKAQFPRRKVCAAGLLEHTFRDFPEVKPFINCYNNSVRVVSPNLSTEFDIQAANPMMAMTNGRLSFDQEMLHLAKKAGAVIKEGCSVNRVEIAEDAAQLSTSTGEIFKSKMIIGADSAHSVVAHSLNLGPNFQKPNQMGLALEKEFSLPETVMDKYFTKERQVSLYLHFGGMLGYGWLFPRKNSVNIGIGGAIDQGKLLAAAFQQFLTHLKTTETIPAELECPRPDGALIPATFPSNRCFGSRSILIGDAGGFCSAATGEGIYYAMMSGRIAAEACSEILPQNDFTAKAMGRFYQLWQKYIGSELRFQYFVKEVVFSNERRCRAAVNWASQDADLRNIFTKFLTGQQTYRQLGLKMAAHYIRCKIKDKLHIFTKPAADKVFEADLKRLKKW